PAMLNAIIALRCLGYSLDDPQMIRALDEFEKLGIEDEDTFRMQPCMSPVWDTAYAMFALGEAGVPKTDTRMVKDADWTLQLHGTVRQKVRPLGVLIHHLHLPQCHSRSADRGHHRPHSRNFRDLWI